MFSDMRTDSGHAAVHCGLFIMAFAGWFVISSEWSAMLHSFAKIGVMASFGGKLGSRAIWFALLIGLIVLSGEIASSVVAKRIQLLGVGVIVMGFVLLSSLIIVLADDWFARSLSRALFAELLLTIFAGVIAWFLLFGERFSLISVLSGWAIGLSWMSICVSGLILLFQFTLLHKFLT
ncbi:MAG: hypothetical protein Q7U28_13150 [Aquabacterium sp.]|nr:hypothetical protein [Aquabacterium sp.]